MSNETETEPEKPVELHNPEVYVGNVRRIAARGLIPGHEGQEIEVDGQWGHLKRFYHRSDGYTEIVFFDAPSVAVPHLHEIAIRA